MLRIQANKSDGRIVQHLGVNGFLIAMSGIETIEPERVASVPQVSATRCAWAKKPYPGI
jgi:hypothetical protein